MFYFAAQDIENLVRAAAINAQGTKRPHKKKSPFHFGAFPYENLQDAS